jgi:uncharacterized protein
MEPETAMPPIEVPAQAVSPEALSAIIDDFILREGTDYGAQEIAHESKVRRVRQQLEKGDVKITFDPKTETVTLLTKNDWLRLTTKRPTTNL